MVLHLDLDYAAELAPHEFERFASLIDPSLDRRSPATAWYGVITPATIAGRAHGLGGDRPGLFRKEPMWQIVQQLDLPVVRRQVHSYPALR